MERVDFKNKLEPLVVDPRHYKVRHRGLLHHRSWMATPFKVG
jgi:hypothetical protein